MSILATEPIGFRWPTLDPFLFCVHHSDGYPQGNGRLGIDRAALSGRDLGMDFSAKDGWSMYHGHMVPGFPRHPHRGFETVTLARRGLIDHSDSLGATARFGHGDVQWMTAGAGIVHSEMFPLVNVNESNPTELFQIWLNLPRAAKMVDPHFSMLWSEAIPRHRVRDSAGKTSVVTTVAGGFGGVAAPPPPPSSWAAEPESALIIWIIAMEPNAVLELPAASPGSQRVLYFFVGDSLAAAGVDVRGPRAIHVRAENSIELRNGASASELVVLGGRPIGEPVAQEGPFVMNRRAEILEAVADFRRTGFGGWPWPSDAPVHAPEATRFAIHADGRREQPPARSDAR